MLAEEFCERLVCRFRNRGFSQVTSAGRWRALGEGGVTGDDLFGVDVTGRACTTG